MEKLKVIYISFIFTLSLGPDFSEEFEDGLAKPDFS